MGLLLELAKGTQRDLTGKQKVEDKGWSLREGIILFPETRCPFCEEVVRSKAIWLVDTKMKRLLGQGVPEAGKKFKLDPPKHPHVFTKGSGGGTCMGNSPDIVTALFSAYNPSSLADASQLISTWFRGKYWEHDCQGVGRCCRCSVETGKLAHREWKGRYYCRQCWTYEGEPLKKADLAREAREAAAKALTEKLKKNPKESQSDAVPITLSALLGEPEEPRTPPPEIPGFRFLPSGAGTQIVVVPVEELEARGSEEERIECPICGDLFPRDEVTDCGDHEDYCHSCHDKAIARM